MKQNITLRWVTPEDAAALAGIYAPYVRTTAITFEYEPPTAEEFRRRICHTLERYPYFAAESEGRIVGYAYAGPFHPRAAYDWDAELSIYVDRDCRGKGVGRKLYTALEHALGDMHLRNLYACIACPPVEDEYLTLDSVRFHSRMGYAAVGTFRRCGYKFGRWYDMVWMEKYIAPQDAPPLPVVGAESFRARWEEQYGIEDRK